MFGVVINIMSSFTFYVNVNVSVVCYTCGFVGQEKCIKTFQMLHINDCTLFKYTGNRYSYHIVFEL